MNHRASPWSLAAVLAAFMIQACAASDWITHADATLETSSYFDGDSFHAVTAGKTRSTTYVFRLYGADCPETDARYADRNKTQAGEFAVALDEVTRWGEKAKEFTSEFLRRPFIVHTRKEKARGTSDSNRYYAIVTGHDGRDLGEALVRAGLARAFGFWPETLPDLTDGEAYRRKLERAEAQARTDRIGIWAGDAPAGSAPPGFFKSKLPFE